MKKLLSTIGLVFGLALLTVSAHAQTNMLPPSSFIDTATGYFTSFNTNFATTFGTNTRGTLWTGAVLQNNVNIGQEVGASYNIGKGFSIEAATLNLGVFNTIESQELGIGYNLVIVDTKITAELGGGMRFAPKQGFIAGSVMLEKALTTHTFAGLRVEIQSGGKNDLVPELAVITGFSF